MFVSIPNSGALIELGCIRTRNLYMFLLISVSVSALLTAFARTLKLGNDITKQISIGGMLHDIGGKCVYPMPSLTKWIA